MDLLAPALARVAAVEAAAADALAPAEEIEVDGWRLRFNRGVSRRGNSALPERRGRIPLARKLREVEEYYRERGLPARIQLSAAARPGRLHQVLDERAWGTEAGARVLWASARHTAGGRAAGRVSYAERPGPDYLEVQEAVAPGTGEWALVRARRLVEVGLQPWHLVLAGDDGPVSAVLGVHDPGRRMVGLFTLATLPAARGRGAAATLVAALRERAADAGAEGVYLQVDVRNEAAMRLYGRAGFAVHHRYDYRLAPEAGRREPAASGQGGTAGPSSGRG